MPVRGTDDRVVPARHPGGAALRPTAGRGTGRHLSDLDAPPAGYRGLRLGETSWWVTPQAAPFLEASGALDLLAGPVRRAKTPEEGRGGIRRLHIGVQPAVGKRLLHGGLLGGMTRGTFLGAGRVEQVVTAAARLRARGVPTPEVIAIGWRPLAGPFGALALITAAIESGRNLLQLLPEMRAGTRERIRLLRAAGATVARLEATGFAHADLNLANLVATLEGETARVTVVDLEGGRFVASPRAVAPDSDRGPQASPGLLRLMRSWEKWVEPQAPGSRRDLAAFLLGYTQDRVARRRLAHELMRYRSGLGARRLRWWLGA